MPRNVTISAEVGVLTNSSSTPAALEYCREWARKMLRLQKPDPWVDLMPAAACAGPPSIMPGPIAMVTVEAAAAPFRKRRRDGTAAPEKSISESLGKCVQPMRSHMSVLLDRGWRRVEFWRCSGPDNSLAAAANSRRHRNCRHANRREPLMRPALTEREQGPCQPRPIRSAKTVHGFEAAGTAAPCRCGRPRIRPPRRRTTKALQPRFLICCTAVAQILTIHQRLR